MQRRAPFVRAIHPLVDIGACRAQLSNRADVAHGDCRQKRMSCAVREQVVRYVHVVGVVEADCPSESIELVQRSGANRIGAMLDEQLDDREIAGRQQSESGTRCRHRRGCSDRRRGRAEPARLFVSTAEVQSSAQTGIARQRAANINQIGMFVEDRANAIGAPLPAADSSDVAASPTVSLRRGPQESDPALVSALARQRMLHVAKRRVRRQPRLSTHARDARLRRDRLRGSI